MINSSDVSGIVYYDGTYIPVGGIYVTVGNSNVRTDQNGKFRFVNVSYPFDVTILDTVTNRVSIYKKLSSDNLDLFIDRNGYGTGGNSALIKVTIPDSLLNNNTEGQIIFTDGEYINSNYSLNPGITNLTIGFKNYDPVTGKLILLTFRKNSLGKITSYENFGLIENVRIFPGGIFNYTFDSVSISLNPGEETVSGSVNNPSGYYEDYSGFTFSFTDKNIQGYYYSFLGQGSGNIFNFLIPAGIPVPFNILYVKSYYLNSERSIQYNYVYPNASNIIDIKEACKILSPENGSKSVNYSTPISFSDGALPGIYKVKITNRSRWKEYVIYTSSNNITLEGLDQVGLGSLNNNDFLMGVEKYGPFESVNDYVKNFKNRSEWFLTYSKSIEFTTEP